MTISDHSFIETTAMWDCDDLSYCDNNTKRLAHNRARRILRLLAERIGIPAGRCSIRSNPGGIAVSGEVTLHTERIGSHGIYIQVGQSSIGKSVMFRTCNGITDYVGHQNHFGDFRDLLGSDEAVTKFAEQIQRMTKLT